jgi:hypothetical protein
MQGRARQVRDGWLQRIKAVVQRQNRVAPEGHDHGLRLDRQDGGMNGLRPHPRIADARPLAPLLHRGRANPVAARQPPYALFTPLYRSTDCLSRRGAAV